MILKLSDRIIPLTIKFLPYTNNKVVIQIENADLQFTNCKP